MPSKKFIYFYFLVIVVSFSIGVVLGYFIKLTPPTYVIEFNEIKNITYEVIKDVESIRGLKFKSPPEVVVANTSWVLSRWGPQVAKEESFGRIYIS